MISCNRISHDFIGFHRISSDFVDFARFRRISTDFAPDFDGFHRISPDFTGFRRISPDFVRFCWISLRISWILPDNIGFQSAARTTRQERRLGSDSCTAPCTGGRGEGEGGVSCRDEVSRSESETQSVIRDCVVVVAVGFGNGADFVLKWYVETLIFSWLSLNVRNFNVHGFNCQSAI